MKRLFFIAMIALAGTTSMHAQKDSGFEIGGNVGVSFAAVSDIEGQNSTDALTSFNIAATGEYYFSDRWGLKTKLILDNKGWANGFIIDQSLNTVITDFKLRYLTIPVMANWHFGSTRKWYLNFGLYAGFLLNAEDSELGLDVKDGFESTDFGLAAGVGYKFPIGDNANMFVEYDSQSGFSKLFSDSGGETITTSRGSINFGVLFSLD